MAIQNSAQKQAARDVVRKRDGDKCSLGIKCDYITGDEYRKKVGHDFDLHHLDRNVENNPKNGSNHALACHPCNCARDPRGPAVRPKFASHLRLKEMAESVSVSEREERPVWDRENPQVRYRELEIKEKAYPLFERAVLSILRKHGPCPRRDVINGACKDVEKKAKKKGIKPISQATGGRYLDILAAKLAESAELKYYDHVEKDGKTVVYVWFRQDGKIPIQQTGSADKTDTAGVEKSSG